jgi:hypothetical protein
MKFLKTVSLTSLLATSAGTAFAGTSAVISEPEVSSGGGVNGGAVLLVMLGAILLLNGGFGNRASSRGVDAPQTDDASKGDVIMKF